MGWCLYDMRLYAFVSWWRRNRIRYVCRSAQRQRLSGSRRLASKRAIRCVCVCATTLMFAAGGCYCCCLDTSGVVTASDVVYDASSSLLVLTASALHVRVARGVHAINNLRANAPFKREKRFFNRSEAVVKKSHFLNMFTFVT